ncbi:hypothetical protein [Microbulbifer aggregans]|uniref:hypothetical protein n=1 Tax=Microbulbifer aggregans TaxID=1769779 RepID=UPI001CFE217C|nr:hypothetical protein [Microbulbifer aggregans]
MSIALELNILNMCRRKLAMVKSIVSGEQDDVALSLAKRHQVHKKDAIREMVIAHGSAIDDFLSVILEGDSGFSETSQLELRAMAKEFSSLTASIY